MKDDQYRFLALAGQLPAPREAWEMGLDGESSVYPSVPLLEQWVHGSER